MDSTRYSSVLMTATVMASKILLTSRMAPRAIVMEMEFLILAKLMRMRTGSLLLVTAMTMTTQFISHVHSLLIATEINVVRQRQPSSAPRLLCLATQSIATIATMRTLLCARKFRTLLITTEINAVRQRQDSSAPQLLCLATQSTVTIAMTTMLLSVQSFHTL